MSPRPRPTFAVSAYDVTPTQLIDIARAAEAAGFDGLWLGEHLVQPVDYGSAHPGHAGSGSDLDAHYPTIVTPSTSLLDPMVALAAVAAATSRIRLGTAIYLLPLRHPLLTARAVATLAGVAPGRFSLGVGAGWLQEEFDAFEIPFAGRGRRHEEAVRVLRAALAGGPFDHDGDYYRFRRVQVSPVPVDVPVVMGGNSPGALRRAARLADGWFASGNPTLEEAAALVEQLDRHREEAGRPHPLPCHVRVPTFDPPLVDRYLDAGLTNLVFWAQDVDPDGRDPVAAFAGAARRLGIRRPGPSVGAAPGQ